MKRIEISKLKPGDRFSFIPRAWHGPARVLTSQPSGEYWKITFENSAVINPPGISYDSPARLVMLLAR